jgi:hypothetical protein
VRVLSLLPQHHDSRSLAATRNYYATKSSNLPGRLRNGSISCSSGSRRTGSMVPRCQMRLLLANEQPAAAASSSGHRQHRPPLPPHQAAGPLCRKLPAYLAAAVQPPASRRPYVHEQLQRLQGRQRRHPLQSERPLDMLPAILHHAPRR